MMFKKPKALGLPYIPALISSLSLLLPSSHCGYSLKKLTTTAYYTCLNMWSCDDDEDRMTQTVDPPVQPQGRHQHRHRHQQGHEERKVCD